MIIFYGERPHCLRKWCGFCVFFGLNCKKKLNITLFLHFLVIKFAHNKKAY